VGYAATYNATTGNIEYGVSGGLANSTYIVDAVVTGAMTIAPLNPADITTGGGGSGTGLVAVNCTSSGGGTVQITMTDKNKQVVYQGTLYFHCSGPTGHPSAVDSSRVNSWAAPALSGWGVTALLTLMVGAAVWLFLRRKTQTA